MRFKTFLSEKLKLTLQYHDELNPVFWQDSKLVDDAKDSFLKYAEQFAAFAKIPHKQIKDVIFTGSNCGFNYTKFSDCDIHLICDESGLTSDGLYDAKIAWQNKHKRLKVSGYPLELYAQDENAHLPSDQGQYSLISNSWLVEPKHLDHVEILQDPQTNQKISYYIHLIQSLIAAKDSAKIRDIKKKFYETRTAGLQRAGEFSQENVIYKELRNRGWILKMNKFLKNNA